MSAMTCDLCGGALRMGTGGIAACSNCGMEHSQERVQEKAQSVTGTVQVDSSHLSDNFLNMARGAIEAGNHEEAEGYCNRILETDTNSADAWWIKGEAAGWQSTLRNPRIGESATCIRRALELNSYDPVQVVQAEELFSRIGAAFLRLRMERFARRVTPDSRDEVLKDLRTVQAGVNQVSEGQEVDLDPMWSAISSVITDGCIMAYTNCQKKFDGVEIPREDHRSRLWDEAVLVDSLLRTAATLSDSDLTNDARVGRTIVKMLQKLGQAQIYYRQQNTWSHGYSWKAQGWSQAQLQAIDHNVQWGRNLENGSAEKSREREAQERLEAYWSANEELKTSLISESESLLTRQAELREALEQNDDAKTLAQLQEQIATIDESMSELGFTKRKEKKEFQDQRDQLEATLREQAELLEPQLRPMRDEIDAVTNRLQEISQTLSEPR